MSDTGERTPVTRSRYFILDLLKVTNGVFFTEKSKKIRRAKTENKEKRKKSKSKRKKTKPQDLYSLDNDTLEAMLDAVAQQDSTDLELSQAHLDCLQDSVSSLSLDMESDSEEESESSSSLKKSNPERPKEDSTPPVNTFRKRSSAVTLEPEIPLQRRRSTSRAMTPQQVRKGANLGTSPLARARRRPDLNRDALAALPKTPSQSKIQSPPIQSAKTVSDLEGEKKQKDIQKASVTLRKRLLRDSTISSSSLYRARRCSVMMGPNKFPLSAVQVEVESIRNRSSTVTSNQTDQNLSSEKSKLVNLFEKTLSDSWRSNLFKRFLSEKHADNILDFYNASKQFSISVKKVESLDPNSNNYAQERDLLRKEGRQICSRFITDSNFPKQVRCMLKESTWPLLSNISEKNLSSLDDSEILYDTDTLSGSDITESSSDDEMDCFVPELDSESMLLLGTDDPKLLRRSYCSIKPHLLVPNISSQSKKLIEGFAFYLPERKIFSILLDDLFSEFLCSHNQVYNMSRSYSESSVCFQFAIQKIFFFLICCFSLFL